VKITIIGLSRVATSLALALKAANDAIEITGYDADLAHAGQVKKLGAIDRSHWNLPAACEKGGLVLIDVPFADLPRMLEVVSESAPPEAVVIDLLPVKRPVLAQVTASLAHPERYVGGHLLCSAHASGEAPSAADVHEAPFYLVTAPETSAAALDVATNLAVAVGAVPRYVDAQEHDGLVAATCQLPAILAGAAIATLDAEGGRQDRGAALERTVSGLVAALGQDPDAQAFVDNGENLLYWIDRYVVELGRLRDIIADSDPSALAELLRAMTAIASRWSGRDADNTPTPMEQGDGGLRSLLLGGLGRRRSAR